MRKLSTWFLSLMLVAALVFGAVAVMAADAPALPTANVSEIENEELTFALNFKAAQANAEQLAYYGDWYADFELTVNKDITLYTEEGADGYLSGQYDAWSENWVNVPFNKAVSLKAGETVKVMAFAAELMGKPGLKYTYKEVYESVKDFDCGMFLTEEYMQANPDLEVTLGLYAYNNENEAERYLIGRSYTFCLGYVAQNVQTGVMYDDVSDAMQAAADGQTVRLLKNADELVLTVKENTTLDLNGHELAVTYASVFGFMEDNSANNTGVLKVADTKLLINSENTQLPVKTEEGYRFVEVIGFNTAWMNENTFVFQPLFEKAGNELLKNGVANTGVSIQVEVTWKPAAGSEDLDSRTFKYGDTLVNDFIGSYNASTGKYGRMFTLALVNPDNYVDLSCHSKVVSTTRVEFAPQQGNAYVTEEVQLTNEQASAVVPVGTKLKDANAALTLNTTEMDKTTTDVVLTDGETMLSMDVHVDGVAADNTVPVIVTLNEITMNGLNEGNIALYHVENGETVKMTRVYTIEEVDEHNEYYYDIATGTITMALKSFSEIAVVSEDDKAWEGKFDYTWYDAKAKELTIANADQLAAFGAIVGGMNGQTQNSFKGKTVKLISDINLGDDEKNNKSNIIFYPIGYYNSEGTYERTNTAITSGLRNFEGTFDGNGHTVSNFYQNTWEMKGDHDWYTPQEQYYRDGMGLFGRVYGGTIKNLTVKNFSSDGEIATTGCIAAYADFGATFENIAIFNCNPKVYNIGNGGIVGCVGWYTKGETDKPVTFRNITVDNSNKISALWGSYDVACGGIVGQYYPTSGQSSANYPVNGGLYFENCHVSAQMDVYNDVCANYQYYAYRYTGMLIGSVRENETINGHVYPKMDGITASGCTVHFGTWNDYYYCEIIDNTTASYTHDYQMSRLTEIKAIDGTTVTYLDDTTGTVPGSGRANYVIVDYTKGHGTENATCYHFKNGEVWNHTDAGTEKVNGEEVLVEDKQHIYLEFNNLVTGYGWGVTTKGVDDLDGVDILDRKEGNSVEKFAESDTAKDSYTTGTTVTIGELFKAASQTEVKIIPENIIVSVSPAGEDSTAGGTYTADAEDWTKGTLKFSGLGNATITITDYYFCEPTTISVIIGNDKFVAVDEVAKLKEDDSTALGKLFEAVEGAVIADSITVTVTVNGTTSQKTVESKNWTDAVVVVDQPGTHTVTITDNNNCVVAEQTVIVNEEKFVPVETTNLVTGSEVTIGQLFEEHSDIFFDIDSKYVEITIDKVVPQVAKRNTAANDVGVTLTQDFEDWTKSVVTFNSANLDGIKFTITDNNYCIEAVNTVTVEKAYPTDYEDKLPTGLSATYGDTLEKVTLPAGFKWVDSNSSVGNVGTNNFAATYNPDEANYYNASVTLTVTVGKADPIVPAVSVLTATYGETLKDVDPPVGFSWKDATLSVGNAGASYSFAATYNPDKNNYNDADVTLTVTVNKANPTVIDKPTGLTASEGQTLADVALTDGFAWKNPSKLLDTEGAQEHTAIYTPKDTDNYNTVEVTLTVTVIKVDPVQKFETKFTGDFLYRVGNQNAVKLGSLFKAKDGVKIGNVDVTVEAINGTAASGTYTANDTWTNGTIKFKGTGVVKVTITDNNYCTPTELKLQVVDAVNATAATNATSNNVVLLNDAGFGSLEVSGGYSLYGNGFTLTCGSDSAALDMGYSFVTLNSGTLDNVQIVCPNFDYAVLYKSNMTESGNRSETTDRTRYFNVKSGVMVTGNSQILNSRISGARAAVNVSGGNLLIDNSRIELGAVASILVGSANSLTLRDVTLIQRPTSSTYNPNKQLMGFSVLVMGNVLGETTPITLEGTLVQNAWINESHSEFVPSAGKPIIDEALTKTNYLHDLDSDNKNESLNLGIAYMPETGDGFTIYPVNKPNVKDNRTNIATVPYDFEKVTNNAYVYSYKNSNGTVDAFKNESGYISDKYSAIVTATYSDTAEGLTTGKSYGTDGWVYELNVDLDKLSGYTLDFSKLTMTVNGESVTDYKVNGNAKPASPIAVTSGGTTYTLTATIDGQEYTALIKVTGTETSKESPSLVASNYEAGLCVASSYGGTWHGAAPALQGIQVKYWSVAEKQYKTIKLSDYTPTTKGQQNGTNTTWTYSPANGDFTLTLTGGQVHSSNNVYAMPVVCNGKLYFVAASSKGLVNSGNSARTIPVSYTFKDNNNGDVLTFSHTWSVAENKDAQYNYSDFCKGTLTQLQASSGGGCVTSDTMITLANGTQVRVDELTGIEELLVWNMVTGQLDRAAILFVDQDAETEVEVVYVTFSDGTEVKVIYEHGFWDYDLNRYVYLDENAAAYIGHTFAKQNGDSLEKVTLTDVVIETEITTAWSPVTADHLCYFVNGMLSMPGGVGGLFNIFEVDSETMTYDLEKMQQDIETYGLFTYEELKAYAPSLTEEMFELCGGAYLKISIGKGNMTMDELVAMINRYSKFF